MKHNENWEDVELKLTQGNIAARYCLDEVEKNAYKIDPHDVGGKYSVADRLIKLKIFGPDLEYLWVKICNKDLQKFLLLLRAYQMDFIDGSTIKHVVFERTDLTTHEWEMISSDVYAALEHFSQVPLQG